MKPRHFLHTLSETGEIVSRDGPSALRERAMGLHQQAWLRIDGGQELTIEAMELEAEADRLEDLLADSENGPAG